MRETQASPERRMRMKLKHKITVYACGDPVLKSGTASIRSRLLNLLLGTKVGVLVLTPGDSVETVEIREQKGHDEHEQN
jgi:hypothetical protein